MRPTLIPDLAPVTGSMRNARMSGSKSRDGQRNDEELVLAAQDGDTLALDELLSRYRNMLYYFARRIAANADEADDVVQESMLRIFTNIGKFRRESRFASWAVSIVVNSAISIRRKEKGVHWIYLDEQNAADAQRCNRSLRDVRPTPEDYCSRHELHGLLRSEVRKLHPKYRIFLQACVFNQCSIKQVAHSLGMGVGSAKSRLHRAKWNLSAAMEKSGAVDTRFTTERHRI